MFHVDGCPSGKKIRYMYCDIVIALFFFFALSVLDAPAVLFHITQFLLNEKLGGWCKLRILHHYFTIENITSLRLET